MSLADSLAKAVVKEENELKLGDQREKARLKLEPFKTRYAPFSKETEDELKGWQPPSDGTAYILLEKKYLDHADGGEPKIRYNLYTMRVGSRPEQLEKLRCNVQVKGMRILHWDRFPNINDKDAKRAQMAKMHFDPSRNMTAYEILEAALIGYATNSPSALAMKMSEKDDEIAALKKKLADAEKKEGKGGSN